MAACTTMFSTGYIIKTEKGPYWRAVATASAVYASVHVRQGHQCSGLGSLQIPRTVGQKVVNVVAFERTIKANVIVSCPSFVSISLFSRYFAKTYPMVRMTSAPRADQSLQSRPLKSRCFQHRTAMMMLERAHTAGRSR